MTPFYCPRTRTFTLVCRQSILALAAGPVLTVIIGLIWGVFP